MQHSEGFIKLVNEAKSKIKECTVDDIYQMYISDSLDGLLIDTREESEFANGYIPNSIHISKGLIECRIEQLIPNKNLKMYFYCGGGFRSALVTELLQSMGYKNVISVDGGWRAWNTKNYPIITSENFKPTEYIKLINNAKSNIKEISAAALYNMYKDKSLDGIVIDVREDSEFSQLHIPGATHLSKGQIEVKIENLIPNKAQKIYLYCGSGYRSALAAFNLQKMGYTTVVSVNGGIQDWVNNNYPITQEG
ncbi:rhodanese-related sulfurtransferase [Allofrancisella inopinata]|uniref:Rhodanese n=1 Tax=Allofrancisella inopinata TaxID=1085647 RepID=A0AAE6YJD8_9GAMM|nr:rhodanese-like domain-containing protein [Allofrancisella inopinata]QIV95832.1 rhodanese [Allofrancisella inopinata]TDT72872.1 rhodanese-related sulfurtransferase [Allofrancisella inopinata]